MSNEIQKSHGLESWLRSSSRASRHQTSRSSGSVTVEIVSEIAHFNVRGNADDADFLSAATQILGQSLPLVANSVATQGEQTIYWLGPNEWLLVAPPGKYRGGEAPLAMNDLSGGQIVLRLSGKATEQLLAKGCTLDLTIGEFPVGVCAQSGLAKTVALVSRYDDKGGFDIIVRRSFSEYLMKWLRNAGDEFGIEFEEAAT